MKITLRTATAADSEFAYATKKTALGEAIALTWGWNEARQREFHEKDYQPAITEIITVDDAPAGLLIVLRRPLAIEVSHICLRPEFQNRGIGTALFRDLITESEWRHVPLALRVLKVNRARAFYERHGFVRVGDEEHHFLMQRAPCARLTARAA